MKITKHIKIKTKEDLFKKVKESKTLPFFRVYQQFIRHSIITPTIYYFLIIIEVIQLFYEITVNDEDFISNKSDKVSQASSKIFFMILQYINFSHFINPIYLSLNNFLIIYIITILIIYLNFLILIVLDNLNKFKFLSNRRFKILHKILGFFNYFNLKILIIPASFVLIQSFFIFSFSNEKNNNIIMNDVLINNLTNTSNEKSIPKLNGIIIEIFAGISFIIYLCTIITTSLLLNDMNPIKSKLCWSQSYSEIEILNIFLKIFLVFVNNLDIKYEMRFHFFKKVFVLLILVQKCFVRIKEWYYSSKLNQATLTIIDYSLFFLVFSFFFDSSIIYKIDLFLIVFIISVILGVLSFFCINFYQRRILGAKVNLFNDERHFCQLIMKLIFMIKQLSNDNKTINDPYFFGFINKHNKYCKSSSCISFIMTNLILESKSKFSNEIENFEIYKNEFNLYCKTNSKNSLELLNDLSKSRCEKIIYSLITCIISFGIRKLPKEAIRILPIIEAYIYIHVFDNKFYALFQIMKYYKTSITLKEKFFFYTSLNDVLENMSDESNMKFTSTANIVFASDYYYYNEKFIFILRKILKQGQILFNHLINLKPLANDVINKSLEIGKNIRKLNESYKKILSSNPYEINILRIYTFVTEKLYLMKKTSLQNKIRLSQNIKYFLMNDKFKNSQDNTKNTEIFNKLSIKNFHENSDSSLFIISGILDNLGKILYCNNITMSILGYDKKDLIGFSLNKILPQPINSCHNEIVLNFYKTGKRKVLDHISNFLVLHKNGTLVGCDVFTCTLPSMEHGLMFIGLFRTSNVYNVVIDNNNNDFNLKKNIIQIEQNSPEPLKFFKAKSEQDEEEIKLESSEEKTSPRKDRKDLKLNQLSNSPPNIKRVSTFHQRTSNKNFVFKLNETGLIMCNQNYDILHMNSFSLFSFFGIKTAFPPGKINFGKVCKEFSRRKIELESGEAVQVIFDLSILNHYLTLPVETGDSIDKDIEETSMYNTKKLKYSTITNSKIKSVKISMFKIFVPLSNGTFYYLIAGINALTNDNNSLISESDSNSDFGMMYDKSRLKSSNIISDNQNSDKLTQGDSAGEQNNNAAENLSGLGEIENGNIEKTKEHRIEKIKINSLNNKFIPQFSRLSNILTYLISFALILWVIVSFVIELAEINSIKDELKLFSKNELLINVIEYFIIESLLLVRGKLFSFSNSMGILPLLDKFMNAEKNNIYYLMNFISNYYSSEQSQVFLELISKKNINFTKIFLNGTTTEEDINMELALKKLIFNMEFIQKKEKYKNMSENQFFDKNFWNIIKTKLFFIYSNFFEKFEKNLEIFSETIKTHLTGDLISKRNKLLIIFFVSILFGLALVSILIFMLYKKEIFKKKFLLFLAGVYDLFYEKRIELLQIFENNLIILGKVNQNINLIKSKLENNQEFKENFISGSQFLSKRSIETKKTKTNDQLSNMTITPNNTLIKNTNFYFQKRKTILKNTTNIISNSTINHSEDQRSFLTLGPKISMKISNKNLKKAPTFQQETEHKKTTLKEDLFKSFEQNGPTKPSRNETDHNVNRPSSFLLNKSKNNFIQEEEYTSKHNDTSDVIESDEEKNEDNIDEDNEKTYTSYNISLWKYTIEIILGIVFINSFFILSIIYLYVYFDSIKIIIKNEILINYRIKSLNNLIIGINLVLLYNDESILGTNTTMRNLIDNINTVEGNFRQILSDISTKSNIYASLLSYDTKDPCSFFSGFNTYYNLITCGEYMTNNGLSFEISQIYNLINIMYDDYLEKGKNDNTSLKEQFNAPDLISLMINNIFFIRLYLNDLTATYSEEYLIQLNNTITIIYVKFIIYLIIILTLIALFRLVLVKKILNMVNNLNRVKVFFDETVFKS